MIRPAYVAFTLISLLVILNAPADANVKLPALISDNMMLQRDIPVPIWGTAAPGEHVKVAIGNQSASTIAGRDGRWRIRLKPMKACGPLNMLVTGKNKINVKNILVGEVWLCAGQSNMVMSVKQCDNAAQEIADAKNYPRIRHYTVSLKASPWPLQDTVGKWEVCSPDTVGKFTATGYFFARDMHNTLEVPVGIILSARLRRKKEK